MADAHHAAHDDHGHGEHHVHPQSHYVKVWGALMVLFFISVLGPMIGIKIVTLITAFGIAVVKASMVVKYFMHLDVEKRFVHYFLALSLAFMFLFFFAVAPDVMNHEGRNWKNVAAMHAVEAGLAAGDGHGEHGGGHEAAGHEGGEAAPAHEGGGH